MRREDLDDLDDSDSSSDGDSSYDSDFEDQLNAQIAKALGIDDAASDSTFRIEAIEAGSTEDIIGTNQEKQTSEDAYEFNLFSTGSPMSKVVLLDPNEKSEGAILHPRPSSHYKVLPLSAEQRNQFAFAALSGDDVYRLSQQRSLGLELPWRVTTIKVTRRAKAGESKESHSDQAAASLTRKRPGKKTRIMRRQKERDNKAKAEELAKKQLEKEEHTKDKKKRMNRIKKLRKRAKEKEMKAAAGGGALPEGDATDDSDD